MINIALIAGTYQPERCGVAHYTACLRNAVGYQSSSLPPMQLPLANDPSIRGAVQDWKLLTSCSWYKRYIGTALIFCIFNTLPVPTGLNVPYAAAAGERQGGAARS